MLTAMPGQHVSKADRGRIGEKYFCPKCGLLLVEPMQTSCGHLICRACVQLILRSSNPVCPKDGTPLTEKEIFPDVYTKRELMRLQLHCPNDDCDWFGPVSDLQNHVNTCDHTRISCVYAQCTKQVKRVELAKHLEDECLYRSIKCKYCEENFPFNSLEEHIEKDCLAAPVVCQHCGLEGIPRGDLDSHTKLECPEIEIECVFKAIGCTHKMVGKRKEMRKHKKDASLAHVELLLGFVLKLYGEVQNLVSKMGQSATRQFVLDEMRGVRDTIAAEISGLSDKVRLMTKGMSGLEKRMESLESWRGNSGSNSRTSSKVNELEVKVLAMSKAIEDLSAQKRRLENQLVEKNDLLVRARTKLEQLDHSVALMTAKFSDLEPMLELLDEPRDQPSVSYNGTLLWRIEQFQRKRQDALNGVKTAVYSPHFFSSQYGYKMCVKIYMNGDGFGKGTHISLFFVVMKGEYDALQVWPFQKKITMMLLDQQNGDHMVDAFHSDPLSSSFQRPKSDMNIASGSPLFLPLDGLNKRSYVKDDVMFIKIIVD